jgi:DNA/RNA-binding protein KIN17
MHQEKERRERSAAAAASASAPAATGATIAGPWVTTGIAVKVMAKQLADYYKQKGVVLSVIDGYVAEVQMNESGDVLRVDQAELETVRRCMQPAARLGN